MKPGCLSLISLVFTAGIFFLKYTVLSHFWLGLLLSFFTKNHHRTISWRTKENKQARKICKSTLFNDDHHLGISNSNFNFYAWLDADGSDLLHDLRRAVQVNEPLMDTHLEAIPGLGTLTTGCLPGSDPQGLKDKHEVFSWCTERSNLQSYKEMIAYKYCMVSMPLESYLLSHGLLMLTLLRYIFNFDLKNEIFI